jgi:chemotaxis protein MotB
MNSALRMAGVLLLAAGLAGCASGGKLKKAEADNAALMGEKSTLQSKADSLQKANSALASDVANLQSQTSMLTAERDSLLKSKEETVTQYDNLVKQLSTEVDKGNLQIKQYKNMLTVNVAEKIFFDTGSTAIKKSGQDVLKEVGTAIAGYPDKLVRVVGHTDNVPFKGKGKYTNWELSAMRATTVVRFLQDQCKIDPQHLVAAGRSEYQPVAANDTPEGRQKNRRIEISLIDKSAIEPIGGEQAVQTTTTPDAQAPANDTTAH